MIKSKIAEGLNSLEWIKNVLRADAISIPGINRKETEIRQRASLSEKDHNEPLLGEYTLSGRNASTRDGRSRGLTLVRVYEGRQHGVNSISL